MCPVAAYLQPGLHHSEDLDQLACQNTAVLQAPAPYCKPEIRHHLSNLPLARSLPFQAEACRVYLKQALCCPGVSSCERDKARNLFISGRHVSSLLGSSERRERCEGAPEQIAARSSFCVSRGARIAAWTARHTAHSMQVGHESNAFACMHSMGWQQRSARGDANYAEGAAQKLHCRLMYVTGTEREKSSAICGTVGMQC